MLCSNERPLAVGRDAVSRFCSLFRDGSRGGEGKKEKEKEKERAFSRAVQVVDIEHNVLGRLLGRHKRADVDSVHLQRERELQAAGSETINYFPTKKII